MDALAELFSTTIKLLALLTPPASLSAFLSSSRHFSAQRKRSTALRTGSAIFLIGVILYFFGDTIFSLFGFTLDAFRIGAGALLFMTAVSLLQDKPDAAVPEHSDADISVVPLAIPISMGPASIGTMMVMGASASSLGERLVGAAALLLASLCVTVMLLLADRFQRLLGRTGLAVLSKLTGLLLAAIAAQVVFTGVRAFMQ